MGLDKNSIAIEVGQSATLVAFVRDLEGRTLTAAVEWSVDDPAVAEVTGGRITARRAGSTVVRAKHQSVSASATLVVTAPARSVAVNNSGQSAVAGSPPSRMPGVTVADAVGNPVANVKVTFAIAAGGGAITGSETTTGADGNATVGGWTLGTVAGPNSLTATVEGQGISGNPASIVATGVAGPPASIAVVSGDGQAAFQGEALPLPPTVVVTDKHGNPVVGAVVAFSVTAGGGHIAVAQATTDAEGKASCGTWTLGSLEGLQAIQASVVGATTLPAAPFKATAQAVLAPSSISLPFHRLILNAGGSSAARAVVRDQKGGVFASTVTYASAAAGIAAVDTTGTVTAVSPGTTTIVASVAGKPGITDSALVIVTHADVPVLMTSLADWVIPASSAQTVSILIDTRAMADRLAAGQFVVQWDPAALAAESATAGSQVNVALAATPLSAGSLKFAFADAAGYTGTIELVRLTLKASASAKTTKVTIQAAELYSTTGNDLLTRLVNIPAGVIIRSP